MEIELDLSPHFWAGEREELGQTSVYQGPILLAFDPTYNVIDASQIPQMDAKNFVLTQVQAHSEIEPWLLRSVKATDGQVVVLCDFATAGAYGNSYVSWLPIRNVHPQPFDRNRQAWINR